MAPDPPEPRDTLSGAGAHGPVQRADAFVGRRSELDALETGLTLARNGNGSLFLAVGEPGIGKTRLAAELTRRGHAHGFDVLWGRSWEGGGAPVYWPWIQILRSLIEQRGPAISRTLGDEPRRTLARIVPELEDRRLPVEIDEEASEEGQFALFDAMSRLLEAAAAEQPVILVIDDLHQADSRSVILLRFLIPHVLAAPIVVYGAYREREILRRGQVAEAVTELRRHGEVLHLTGLAEPDVRQLMENSTGGRPEPGLVDAVFRTTEGNPLFVTETTRLLTSEASVATSGPVARLPIAPSVRQIIREGLNHVSAEALEVLGVAAVLGRQFEMSLLRQASSWDPGRLVEVLDEAIAAGIVVQSSPALGHLGFSHSLFRETIYEDMPLPRRQELHARVGHLLEQRYGDDATPHMAELAHHFAQASPTGDITKALAYTIRAAERSASLFANEEASELYSQALRLLQLSDDVDPRQRTSLLIDLGMAQNMSGALAEAKATFLAAAEEARVIGDAELLAQAAQMYGRESMTTGAVDRTLVRLLEEALEALPTNDSEIRVGVLTRLAMELYYTDQRERRIALSSQAVEMARRIGDPKSLSFAIEAAVHAAAGPDNLEQRMAAGREIVAVEEAISRKEGVLSGFLWQLGAMLEQGDIPRWERLLTMYESGLEDVREPAHRWYAMALRAMQALFEGHFDDAEGRIAEALQVGERGRSDESRRYFTLQKFLLYREQGRRSDLEDVRPALGALVDSSPGMPALRSVRILHDITAGRIDSARADLERLSSDGFSVLPDDLARIAALCLLAESCCELEDIPRMEALSELLAPYLDRNAVFDWSIISLGSVARFLGMLADGLGRWKDAVGYYEKAVAANVRMGARPAAAHSRLGLARALAARDDPRDAQEAVRLAKEARAAFEELGMEEHATRTTRLLVQLGAAPTDAAPETRPPSMFRRDGEYWAVAFEGDAFRLKDAKGLAYLARMLAEPGREFHALDLFTGTSGAAAAPSRDDDLSVSTGETMGPALDPQAKAAYKRRLQELDEEMEEAEAANDPERAAKARQEREFLASEIAAAVGLGGRDRPTGSAAERARVNVTKAIRTAVGRIRPHSEALAQHLDRTIHTGTFCSYQPDPRAQVGWRVST